METTQSQDYSPSEQFTEYQSARDGINKYFCGSLRILIVDDEEPILWALIQHLSLVSSDISVGTAISAEEALTIFECSEIDLLITDLRLPNMNGLELTRAVKDISPETKSILITAYGDNEIQERASAYGCFGYLEKPFSIDELLMKVRNVADVPEFPEWERTKVDESLESQRAAAPIKTSPQLISNSSDVMRLQESTSAGASTRDFSDAELALQPEVEETGFRISLGRDFTSSELNLQPELEHGLCNYRQEFIEERKAKKLKDFINTGINHFRNHRLELAEKCWSSALRLDPKCVQARKNLAILKKILTTKTC